MEKRNIIVIGASAGGFDAIKAVVSKLPEGFSATILVVWHIAPELRGVLPNVLNLSGRIPASNGSHLEELKSNHIYVAPPDRHMLVVDGKIKLSKGPKENRFRPAVDPLFRSAAVAYGSRVIGVVLTGSLNDGAAGLWAIKQKGGLTIVQDPSDAEFRSMPEKALEKTEVDYTLRLEEIAPMLVKLASEEAPSEVSTSQDDQMQYETEIALNAKDGCGIVNNGEVSLYTCPECHGSLTELKEGSRIRFRCHTGHAFSAESLLDGIYENIEDSLWTAMKSLHETQMLLNRLGDYFAGINQPRVASQYFNKANEIVSRIRLIKEALSATPDKSNQHDMGREASGQDMSNFVPGPKK